MGVEARLAALERRVGVRGGVCRVCRGEPLQALVVTLSDDPDADAKLRDAQTRATCNGCGRVGEVHCTRIVLAR